MPASSQAPTRLGTRQNGPRNLQPRGSNRMVALELFSKKSQKTPPQTIALAERRLRDWRRRRRDTKGDADCRISSVERYAAALGFEVRYQLVPATSTQRSADR